MKVRFKNLPMESHAFYDTKIRKNGDVCDLLKEEDFAPTIMEWLEKPKAKRQKKENVSDGLLAFNSETEND